MWQLKILQSHRWPKCSTKDGCSPSET